MSFTVETTLVSPEPNTVILVGPANAGAEYPIAAKLVLKVQQTIVLKSLLVAFNGDARLNYMYPTNGRYHSDTVNIARAECHAILQPTVFQPGIYEYMINLRIPGDVAATSCKIIHKQFIYGYELVTVVEPSTPTPYCPRQAIRKPITLKRVHYQSVNSPNSTFRLSRQGLLECIVQAPKLIDISKDSKVKISISLRVLQQDGKFSGVKEIDIAAEQTMNINQPTILFDDDTTRPGRVLYDPPCAISENQPTSLVRPATVRNLNKKADYATWGTDPNHPIEYEMELKHKDLFQTETLEWLNITHGLRFKIFFKDVITKPLIFVAPITIGNIAAGVAPEVAYTTSSAKIEITKH
ncbi:hypothetical protein BGZ49_005532 [Haplosporangium sp. Z 27]|nr:hypothetical protein BGZ49_005532 [Haplosporangium sp. Z 27]